MENKQSNPLEIYLHEIEKDFIEFEQYCLDKKITGNDLKEILSPLRSFLIKENRQYKWISITSIVLVCLILIIYNNYDTIIWNIIVFTRLILLKLLFVWDWTNLQNSDCLIYRTNTISQITEENFTINCNLCETVKNLTVINLNQSDSLLQDRYLTVYEPVVITFENNEKLDWITVKERLIENDYFLLSNPCDVDSNLVTERRISVETVFERSIASEIFKIWYFHFRNCDPQSIKLIRYLFPKVFMRSNFRTHTNWLLSSLNYSTKFYKSVDVGSSNFVMMTQWFGNNYVRLEPSFKCSEKCSSIHFNLTENNALIYVSNLWKLSYLPGNPNDINLAVLEESYWNG